MPVKRNALRILAITCILIEDEKTEADVDRALGWCRGTARGYLPDMGFLFEDQAGRLGVLSGSLLRADRRHRDRQIIRALSDGPERSSLIGQMLGITRRAADYRLSRLKMEGVVDRDGGLWKLTGAANDI